VSEVPVTHSDAESTRQRSTSSAFEPSRRSSWPTFRIDVVVAIFLGGCVGGYARYAATLIWPTPSGAFPWPIFWVNTAGALILALVVVIASELAPSRYLRPLMGTGFCGALTTFSSVVVVVDQLFAHHHARTAIVYLLATIGSALAASWFGLLVGRAIAAGRRGARRERRSR
jgi:CrcB protein